MKKIFSIKKTLLVLALFVTFFNSFQFYSKSTNLSVEAQSSIDLIPYFLGEGNPGDAVFTNDGQVKYEYLMPVNNNPNGFYIIKSRNQAVYEEFTYDSDYIYHLKDTSWADGSGDIFCTNGNPAGFTMSDGTGSATSIGLPQEGIRWAPRNMSLDETFNSDTTIIAFDKANCVPCDAPYTGNTGRTFHFEALYTALNPFTLPSGIQITDGIKLTITSGPGSGESYWYDKSHGWVAFGRGGTPTSYAVGFGDSPTVSLKTDPTNGGNFACQPFDGFYGESGPGNLLANFGAQQCNVGELSTNRFTSRPAECSSCLDYVPEPVNSCASNFTYTKNLKYTSFNTMTCDNKQCSLNTDACTIELGEQSVDGLTAAPQLLVGPIPWQGRFTLNASTVKQPYVGNDTEESREKYIADYVDGATYYKASIDPGSSPTQDALDPADIFDPTAGQYYSIPPQDPRFVSYAGIVPKLAPQEYLDQLKYSIIDRVEGTVMSDIMPIANYTIGYTWGGGLNEVKLSDFQDPSTRRPLRSNYSTSQEYTQALQSWLAKDGGKWSRLWSYVPLSSRQDTPGRFHPIPQQPSAIVPVTKDEGGTIGNPPPLPGDVPPIPPVPAVPGGGNIPTPPPLPVPSPGVDIWVYGQDPQDTRFTGQVTSQTNSSDTHNLLFRTIKYRDRNNSDTTFVRLASRVNMDFSITFPNTPETSILLSPTSEIPSLVSGNTVTFNLPPTPGNYILKTKNLDSVHGGQIMETLSIFIDDYNQAPQAAPAGSIVLDPVTDNTSTIQSKINAANPNQTFYFAPGTFNLDNLEIRNKNNLFFILNPNTIISQNKVEGYFIHTIDSGKIVFSGAGIIQAHPDNKQTVFYLEKTQNIAVHDLLIYKPHERDGWTLHIYKSDFTRVQNVRIFSGNDGTDPDSSSNITYTNVYIEAQDDAVAIKTRSLGLPTNNLLFQNGFAKSAASALKIGQSSVQAQIDNIVFKDSTVYDSDRSLVVDPGEGDGKIGYVLFDNIKVKWVYGGYPNQLTLKVTNSDTYKSGGKEKDGSKNNYGSNTSITFNKLNADVRQTNLIGRGVTVTNSTFNVNMNNSVFNNCGSLTLQNITLKPPTANLGCNQTSSTPNNLLFTQNIEVDPLANSFASSIPFSPSSKSQLLAQATLKSGQVGNNVYQPFPPDPDMADNQTVQKAPAPVQLQLPHLARLYESSTTLYDLLSPYSSTRTVAPPASSNPTPFPPPTLPSTTAHLYNCAAYPNPSSDPAPKTSLNFMTFNVRFGLSDNDSGQKTTAQMISIANSIKNNQLDIVTLQEMDRFSTDGTTDFTCSQKDGSSGCCESTSNPDTINSLDILLTELKNLNYPMYFSTADYTFSPNKEYHPYLVTLSRYPIISSQSNYDSGNNARNPLRTIIAIGTKQLDLVNLHTNPNNSGVPNNIAFNAFSLGGDVPSNGLLAGDWNVETATIAPYASSKSLSIFSANSSNMLDSLLISNLGGASFTKTSSDPSIITEEPNTHQPLFGTVDISTLTSLPYNNIPSTINQTLFSSLSQSPTNNNVMASSIALSPSSNLQTSNSRLLAQTAPQCIDPSLPSGCYPGGKGCFNLEVKVNTSLDGNILNYCVHANQTCSQITGAIGDCYWVFNGAAQPIVKNILANGSSHFCSNYGAGGLAMPPISASPGTSGVISGYIRCDSINPVDNPCCARVQHASCTYTVNPDGSVASDCGPTSPGNPPPAPAPICAPTVLESVPNCSGTIRTGAGDFLCGVQTYDLIIPQPDERFWNLNTNNSQAINEDGDVTLNADGVYDNLGNACGAAVACDNCTCKSPNSVIGGSSGYRCYYASGPSSSVSNCGDCPSGNLVSCEPDGNGSARKCCGPGSTNSDTDCRPLSGVPAAPNICGDETAPQCINNNGDSACVAKPYGSSVNIIGNRDLDTVPLIYPASREVHIATELPYLGIIYKKLIGFPEGSTQFDPNNTPVYRMFTPFRGSSTKPDTVPWYSYHAGDASGWLSVSNKGEPNSSSINGSQDINQPFFFPYLGAIQDGTQFVRDCLTAGYPNGCTSPLIKDFIQGKVCTVQFKKLSFFINQVDDDLLNYIKTAQPRVIKVMGPALNQTDEIKAASSTTQIVGRFYTTKWENIPNSYDTNDLNSAVQAAQDWISDLKAINPSPNITYWEGINEPVIGPSSEAESHQRMKWLAKFEATRLNLLNTGLNTKGCIGNFSTGNPDNGSSATDFGVWPDFDEAFTAASNTGGVICLHEYATATTTVDGFRMGRFQKMYEYLDNTPNKDLQTIISETGATATGASDSGWRTVFNNDLEKYLTAMKEYDTAINNESRIIGGTLFIYRHLGWPQQEQSPEVLSAIMDGITSGNEDLRCIANQAPPPSGPAVPVDSCFILNETWNLVPPYKTLMTTRLNELSTNNPAYINRVCAKGPSTLYYRGLNTGGNYWAQWTSASELSIYQQMFTSGNPDFWQYYTTAHELGHRLHNIDPYLLAEFVQDVLCQPGESTTTCEDPLPFYPTAWPGLWGGYDASRRQREDFSDAFGWNATLEKFGQTCNSGSNCNNTIHINYPLHYKFAKKYMD